MRQRIEVNSGDYVAAHGTLPRGLRQWVFELYNAKDHTRMEFAYHDTYAEALAAAKHEASAQGCVVVVVQP